MNKGLNTDFSSLLQPSNTYRYALNAVDQTSDGDFGLLSKEQSMSYSASLPTNYILLGYVYVGDGNVVLFSVFNNISEIGILNRKEEYTTLVNTTQLTFDIKAPIRGVFRIRKNNERVIYFVDSINKPRCINIDKLYQLYSEDYYEWLELGKSSESFIGEKWDGEKFNLIKSYSSIPRFESVELLETGSILSGSYSFGIIYLDENLNPTNVITTSNPVIVYNDNTNKEYNLIRGSRNIDSALMSYSNTGKAIKLTISNFDSSYLFYKVVVIQYNSMTGKPSKALLSDLISTNESNYVYDGNDEKLSAISLADISIDKADIDNVEFITQLDNRLILGKYKTKNVDYSSFQKYASKIKSHFTTKKVYLNSIKSLGNPKSSISPFENVGYMPGEVYSFGIVYIFNDGTTSPVYHIPGRNKSDIRESINGFNDNMDYYETPYSKYPDIHKCLSKDNYWGKDSFGDYIAGRSKRHHKFPTRKSRGIPLYTKVEESVTLYNYILTLIISMREGKEYPVNIITGEPIVITCKAEYKKQNSYSNSEYVTLVTNGIKKESISIDIYNSEYELEKINGSYGYITGEITKHLDKFNIGFSYKKVPVETLNPAYYTDIFGIRFDNIEKPHPDIIGYYIVRNEKLDSDRLIVDNAILGPVTALNKDEVKYRVFNKWVNVANGEEVNGSTRDIDDTTLYFFNPEYQFHGKTINFDHVEVQGYFKTSKMTSTNNGEPPSNGDYDTKDYSIVLSDVAEGTSYNPDVHATKDGDGFNLLIGYRNSNVEYKSLDQGDINWSYDRDGNTTIDSIIYVGAANSKFYDGKTYYNACQDNKIGFIKFKDTKKLFNNDTEKNIIFDSTCTKLYYASLIVDNESAYTNFIDRDYFKEHNNPASFKSDGYGESITIFNGDAYVNPSTIVASTYYGMKMADRKKKDKKSSGILGVGLIVVGVVATIFTAGAALGLFGAALSTTAVALAGSAVAAMALSAGASMYSSYLELESLKKMLSEDYPKGLQDAIIDKDMSDHPTSNYPYGCGLKDGTKNEDDAIIWFADRVTDLFIESPVNIGLRTSLTSVSTDFINPLSNTKFDEEEFRSYLIEKLTVIAEGGKTSSSSYSVNDSDKTVYEGTVSGRIYRGFPNTEWYDVNPDYSTKNTTKVFTHLPVTYDSCNPSSDYSQKYNTRVLYSQQSFQEEQIDNYRVFLVNNYKDIDGESGAITDLFKIGSKLFIHTSEGLWYIPKTIQEKVTSELVTYIGTGEFLSIPPIKIDDGSSNFGSQSYFATVHTPEGVFFVNQNKGQIFLLNSEGNVVDISAIGMKRWFIDNLPLSIGNQLYDISQYKWRLYNPTIGSGLFATYDPKLSRVLFTKKDYKFTEDINYVGVFSNSKLDYQEGDVFVGSLEQSNRLYDDNTFYLVSEVSYLNRKTINTNDFTISNNVIISDIDIMDEESFENVTGYWYNRNQYNYETIDYGNTQSMITITDSIDFTITSNTMPKELNGEYVNGYFEFDFTSLETKNYKFLLESSGISKLYINDVEVVNLQADLISGTTYSIRIDFIHSTGELFIKCKLLSQTINNGTLQKIDTGKLVYTPDNNFEGEDYFYVTTDKSPIKTNYEKIIISVKDREGEEKSYPFFHTINQTNTEGIVYSTDTDNVSQRIENYGIKQRRVLVFPCNTDGIIRFVNSINIPHKITIIYNDIQSFTVNNTELWNIDLKDEYAFIVNYDGNTNYFTVIIEFDWKNPLDNSNYIKNVFYTIDYDNN